MRALPILLLTIATASAQSFEVASIRPAELKNIMAGYSVTRQNVRLEVYNIPTLIVEAYGIEQHQLIPSPEVTRTFERYYTIEAKVSGTQSPTRAEVRVMLQELLASRFQLKVHRESRETPVYSLLPGKNGVKLRESKPDVTAVSQHKVRGRNQTIESTHVSMEALARELRVFVDRPVVDKTGLTGKYDINLEATPYFRLTNNPQLDDITVFAAVQETLGLRLEAERVPMPVLVVDAVSQPTEN